MINIGVEQFALRSINLLLLFANNEDLPEEWKKSISLPIYKKGDKTDFSNFRAISLLSNTYKMLSNVLLSKLSPYAE